MERTKWYYQVRKLIYYTLGILEVLLGFRLIFKILGANPQSGFVSLIYSVTGIFLAPFYGIFKSFITKGIETTSVFEPATLVAMLVYALIAYGIVRFLEIRQNHKA